MATTRARPGSARVMAACLIGAFVAGCGSTSGTTSSVAAGTSMGAAVTLASPGDGRPALTVVPGTTSARLTAGGEPTAAGQASRLPSTVSLLPSSSPDVLGSVPVQPPAPDTGQPADEPGTAVPPVDPAAAAGIGSAGDLGGAGDLGVIPDVESTTAPDLVNRTVGQARELLPDTDVMVVNADGSPARGTTPDAVVCAQDPAAGQALTAATIRLVTAPAGQPC